MEDQCRQQRKTSGEKRSGAGEEPQQNRQTAAELKQYGERQQESGTPIASIYCCVPA